MLTRRDKANALRFLSVDAVEAARSGHPGAPLGMADVAEVLWSDFLRHNPKNPNWVNRDRFILSNGHAVALLYALLHVTGYALSLEDLRNFRQLGSKTPGHPERGVTPGVEITTGPLGQGLASAVGIALSERHLASVYNTAEMALIDHYTYVAVGDGCLMEGISHECCSLAGTLGLGKLIVIYDSNHISIDGRIEGWFTDNTAQRFKAYGWQVIAGVDGHDAGAIKKALAKARRERTRPTLIQTETIIGWGVPEKAGSAAVHGAPLGDKGAQALRDQLRWPHAPFALPSAHYQAWDATAKGARAERRWQKMFDAYCTMYPEKAEELKRRLRGDLPSDWTAHCERVYATCQQNHDAIASRAASLQVLKSYGTKLPELLGGSADLTSSNLTRWQEGDSVPHTRDNPCGRYVHYGVREFAMTSINNGIAAYGGLIPYAGTFLVFSDYARNAIRLAALMELRTIFVLTHDSIGLGEDGPTHQPIEHAASLRLIPGLLLWRPATLEETAVAWQMALEEKNRPSAILLSRQKLAAFSGQYAVEASSIKRGGYVLVDGDRTPEVILIATGSELALAVNVAVRHNQSGRSIRVVSMPSTSVFDEQSEDYQERVLPARCVRRIAIEAGVRDCWYKYVGSHGKILGIDQYGASAPAAELFQRHGFSEERVEQLIQSLLQA